MSVFGKYSSYYDLLYKDKDYSAEANFVCGLIERYKPGASSVLELGCGSGRHALEFAKKGLSIHGVDLSLEMLAEAENEKKRAPENLAAKLSFSQGDMRELDIDSHFDSVLSLFHVVSYLPTLADIKTAFLKVHEHLNPGGIFIFDVWYAPAVVSEQPTVRVKKMANSDIEVTRIAEPVWHPNECWVDVCYKVFIRDIKANVIEELDTEVHRMRYLSYPEIEILAELCGMEIVHSGEWMTEKKPGGDTWGVFFVLRKPE
jgi:Cyclopropane fatty acid synthase and related methyltransferases